MTEDIIPAGVYRDYMTIPYVPRGRDHAGADCFGLTRLILREQYDVELGEHPGMLSANLETIDAEAKASGWKLLEWTTPRAWDIASYQIRWGGIHIVLMISPTIYLTTTQDRGVHTESISRPAFELADLRFYRHD